MTVQRNVMVICGGRDYTPNTGEYSMVALMIREMEITHVIHGGARGVDTILGDAIAQDPSLRVQVICVPAMWKKHGAKAGPLRNKEMADLAWDLDCDNEPILVALKGGRGTANMRAGCKRMGFTIADVSTGDADDESA